MGEKTKATLYLEEDLVGRAKESDLNMSKIANNALKQQFGIGRETSKQKNLRELLKDVDEDGRLYSFGFKIAGLELENIRAFDELSLDFQDGLNVIYGPNGTGKSSVIQGIASAVTHNATEADDGLLKHDQDSGSAKVRLEKSVMFRQFDRGNQYDSGENSVLLLDTPFAGYGDEYSREMLDRLKKDFNSQIILTTLDGELTDMADNSIRLRSFTEERLVEVRDRIADTENELSYHKERLADVTSEIDELEEEIENLQASRHELGSLEDEREEVQQSIEKTRASVDETRERLESVEASLEDADSERKIGMLEERRDNLSEQLHRESEQLEEYSRRLEDIESDISELDDESENLQDLRDHLEEKLEKRRELEESIEMLKRKHADLCEEHAEIKEAMEVSK